MFEQSNSFVASFNFHLSLLSRVSHVSVEEDILLLELKQLVDSMIGTPKSCLGVDNLEQALIKSLSGEELAAKPNFFLLRKYSSLMERLYEPNSSGITWHGSSVFEFGPQVPSLVAHNLHSSRNRIFRCYYFPKCRL